MGVSVGGGAWNRTRPPEDREGERERVMVGPGLRVFKAGYETKNCGEFRVRWRGLCALGERGQNRGVPKWVLQTKLCWYKTKREMGIQDKQIKISWKDIILPRIAFLCIFLFVNANKKARDFRIYLFYSFYVSIFESLKLTADLQSRSSATTVALEIFLASSLD